MMLAKPYEWIVVALAMAGVGCDSAPSADGAKSAAGSAKPSSAPSSAASSAASSKPEDKPAGAKVASCNLIKAEGLCREYGEANISAAGEEFIKGLCTGGEFKLEACPNDKRVGSCVTQEGTKVWYNDGPAPLTADKAEKQCKEGVPAGEWKAGQ
jgi:hypothetical protein